MNVVRALHTVAWPAFVAAGLIEALVFAFVDPGALHGSGDARIGLPPLAVYTLAFFAFWALVALAVWMSHLLALRTDEVNVPPHARARARTGPREPLSTPRR